MQFWHMLLWLDLRGSEGKLTSDRIVMVGRMDKTLQVMILEGFVHTAQAISFPRLTFYTITKQ